MLCDLGNLNSSLSLGVFLVKIQSQIFADFGEISGLRKKRNENFISQLPNFFTSRGLTMCKIVISRGLVALIVPQKFMLQKSFEIK